MMKHNSTIGPYRNFDMNDVISILKETHKSFAQLKLKSYFKHQVSWYALLWLQTV